MSSDAKPLAPEATARLAKFASELTYERIPRYVVDRLKMSILDSIGCVVHGSTLRWSRMVQDMAMAEGSAPVASIMGTRHRTSPANAALANGTAGHAFELDDIHKESIIHPGSIALPVAAALAEAGDKVSGEAFVTAVCAGYEVGTRVGNAATMSLFYRGFHPQGSSGAFVAAATAGHMLRLDARQMQQCLGIVGSQAGGLMAAQEGAMVKRFHSGRAAQSGIYAAQLAERGFTGITDVLEAPYGGFLSTYSGDPSPGRLLDGLGDAWEIGKIGYKPHAAVTSIHSALDGLKRLMRENDIAADDIQEIDAGVSKMTYVHCAWPYRAQGVTAAQMNLSFGLAVMALDGSAFVDQYVEGRLSDPRILELVAKVKAHIDPDIESMGPPMRHASTVRVVTRSGKTYWIRTDNRKGSPENPLALEDVQGKFHAIMKPTPIAARADEIVSAVDRIERAPDVRTLLRLLAA